MNTSDHNEVEAYEHTGGSTGGDAYRNDVPISYGSGSPPSSDCRCDHSGTFFLLIAVIFLWAVKIYEVTVEDKK